MKKKSKSPKKPEVVLFQLFSKNKGMNISGLGVNYISAYLNHGGIPSRVLNTKRYYQSDDPHEEILRRLEEHTPRVVGISSLSYHNAQLVDLSRKIKERLPGTVLVAGGYGPTLSERVVLSPHIDLVVRGEGELTMKEVAERVLSESTDFSEIPGVSYVANGKVIRIPERSSLEDLDNLPFPDKNPIDDSPNDRKDILITSRGCPYSCDFCAIPKFYEGRKWRERSKENIVQEIREMVREHGITSVEFFDDEFLIRGERLEEIILEMDKYPETEGMKISFAARSNTLEKNEESLEKYHSRIEEIFCGIESFNPEYLGRLNKSGSGERTLEHNLRAIEMLSRLGISAKYGFITPPDAEDSSFIREHLPLRFPERVSLVDFVKQVASLDNYELPFNSEKEYMEDTLSPTSRRYVQIMRRFQKRIKKKTDKLGEKGLRSFFELVLNYSEDGNPKKVEEISKLAA